MKRYTYKQLKQDIKAFNEKLKEKESKYTLVLGGRNGYTAVDLKRNEMKEGVCERNLVCGSPQECFDACEYFIAGE